MFVVMGFAEPKGITLQQVYLDRTRLTAANAQLATWCGLRPMGTWSESACTINATFGPAIPPPPIGSVHTLRVVENTGASYQFHITSGGP